MKTAVVILNWNGRKLLEEFLPSVVAYSTEATIYVADNASTDDSVAYLTTQFPMVKIIQNKRNGGYAQGYNDALQHLTEDIFVLLNSDVAVTPGWLPPVIAAFQENPELVAAQPKILDYKNKEYFEYAGAAGGYIDKLGYPYCRGRIFHTLEKDEGQYNDTVNIFWASGACLFIRRTAFWEAGALDAHFFAHQEEIDLCWRLHAKGGHIKYIGASHVFHLGGATLAVANPKKTFYNFRNTLLALVKNVKGVRLWWLLFQRMILDGVAAFQFVFQGKIHHFVAVFKAHLSFYRLLPIFLKKRKIHATNFKYYRINNIVWRYFVLKKRTFSKGY
ncbi:glycosyltransferase family 2 protein [Altibacter lentus]|uniref:glycosyltransferase family 2 protein n=1 Tax=Altibacter lentus TaxID=1223410 RepID=UPI00054CD8E7|nr:glycosyltransferase family 2 protein [Altibacter lentus]